MRAVLPVMAATLAWASGPAAWEMTSYGDFIKGRFSGVSLARDGRLILAPRVDALFATEQPTVWSLERAGDGHIYLATGHKGRVFRVDSSGRGSLLWTAPEPEVFALAVDAKGALYAGSSPGGKVYRIQNGKATEYFNPGARYIWKLAFGPDGALYAGTGDQGKVFRITAAGKGEVWYETGQNHVTALAFDREGRLLAGTEPNGILYRIEAKDKAFVLYDANLPEIRSLATAPDGAIYVAALGGAVAARSGAAAAATGAGQTATPAPSVSTSITVTDAQAGIEIKPKSDAAKTQTPQAQVTTQVTPVVDVSGVEKSALYRVNPDHTVETLWSSREENVYDLALDGDAVYFSTDQQGRIYRLTSDRKAALLTDTGEAETLRLLRAADALYAATGSMGKLFRLSAAAAAAGWFESPVHDAGNVARWGRLSFRGETPAGTKLAFRTRSGNSVRPDKTWSAWSEPMEAPDGAPIASPNARFIQWRAEFSGSGGASPVLDSVTVSYLPQNMPPVIRSITVAPQSPASAQTGTQQQQPSSAATYSITVTDTGEAASSTSAGTPTQTPQRTGSPQLKISWQGEDPDGDKLIYSVFFRGEDEREWKTLKSNITDSQVVIDSDVLADGRYFFRVTVSDRLSNPPGASREAELASAPVLIDNTPPAVKMGQPRAEGAGYVIEVEAADAASPLRRAEYSIDAGPWTPLAAEDGVIDSKRETFIVRTSALAPGEHLIVVRVYDSAGNSGLAKVIVRP